MSCVPAFAALELVELHLRTNVALVQLLHQLAHGPHSHSATALNVAHDRVSRDLEQNACPQVLAAGFVRQLPGLDWPAPKLNLRGLWC